MEAGSFFTIALLVVIGIIIFYNKIQKQKPINDKQEGIANNQDSALTETLSQNSHSDNYNDVSNNKAVLHSSEDEKLIFCRNCKNQLTPSTKGCLKCGFPPFSESNFCHECGCETKERQVLCISCNADLEIRSFESFKSSIIIKKVETTEPDNSNSENNSNKHDTQKPQIKNTTPEKVQFKEWWSERTKKQKIWIVVGCLFFIGLVSNLSGGGVSESDISTATFSSGYYYLFFKDDHTIRIYQKSSSKAAASGCTADGKWSIESGKVKVQVVRSYCGTESYSKFNGTYTFKGKCIENDRFSFCKNY